MKRKATTYNCGMLDDDTPRSHELTTLNELHKQIDYDLYRINGMIQCKLYANAAKAMRPVIALAERADKLHSAKG